MKEISSKQQKELLLEMLKYLDKICRDNNINYSLIGGSLIGAVRHGGFIPWDDDIDIIMTKPNYEKFKTIAEKKTGRYRILKYQQGGKKFSFIKLIDTKTHLVEKGYDYMKDYGIFVDIFCYFPTSNDKNEQLNHCRDIKKLRSTIICGKFNFSGKSFKDNGKIILKKLFFMFGGYKILHKRFNKTCNRFANKETGFVVSNWPTYAPEKEIQLAKNVEEYVNIRFEDMNAMAFKGYDNILRNTFGDYMKEPPKSQQEPRHDTIAWWRDDEK